MTQPPKTEKRRPNKKNYGKKLSNRVNKNDESNIKNWKNKGKICDKASEIE